MDSAIRIPGTNVRLGLDPILGLVPGIGDLASALASIYIVLTGIQLGAPRSVVVRMIANIGIDTLVGSVPILGDLFDVGWKSNNRNVALIEEHVGRPEATRRASRTMLVGAIAVLVVLLAVGIAASVWIVRALVHLAST
jgi:hypothetical protein